MPHWIWPVCLHWLRKRPLTTPHCQSASSCPRRAPKTSLLQMQEGMQRWLHLPEHRTQMFCDVCYLLWGSLPERCSYHQWRGRRWRASKYPHDPLILEYLRVGDKDDDLLLVKDLPIEESNESAQDHQKQGDKFDYVSNLIDWLIKLLYFWLILFIFKYISPFFSNNYIPSFPLLNQKTKIGKVMEHSWKYAILFCMNFLKILRELQELQTPLYSI